MSRTLSRPTKPGTGLGQYIPEGHRADLARKLARWQQHGISEAAVTEILARVVGVACAVDKGLPRWNRQAREARAVRERLVRSLERAEALYRRPEYVGRPRSSLRKHVRALLAYIKIAERVRLGKGGLQPQSASARAARTPVGLTLWAVIEYSDPLVPPLLGSRGPRGWLKQSAREDLAALGLGRRDVSWLMQHADAM